MARNNKLKPRLWEWDYLGMKPLLKEIRFFAEALPNAYTVLDIGCGEKPYKALFKGATQYVGLDMAEGPNVDVVGLAWDLPFPDNSFDVIIITQVLEHIRDVEKTVAEIQRVAKPDASIFASAPLTFLEHGAPHDYWRFTRYGFEHLFRNFNIVSIHDLNGYVNTLCRMINTFIQYFPFPRILFFPLFFFFNVVGLSVDATAWGLMKIFPFTTAVQKAYKVYRAMPENYAVVLRNNASKS